MPASLGSSSALPGPPIAPFPSGARRGPISLAALLVALALALAFAGYATYQISIAPYWTNVPPHVVAVLSQGSALLEVPLMTMYTAPSAPLEGLHTNMSFWVESRSDGPSSNFTYHWQNASGIGESVRFVLESGDLDSSFQPLLASPEDGFVYFPAGICTSPCTRHGEGTGMGGIGIEYLFSELWLMNYTVVRMSVTAASLERTWIQVNYSLAVQGGRGNPLPTGNVTIPSPADLIPVGSTATLHYSRGTSWYELGLAGSMIPSNMSFRHSLPPVTIRGGVVGDLTVSLAWEFRWDQGTEYWLGWGFGPASGDGTISYRYLVDVRFGSILLEFGS